MRLEPARVLALVEQERVEPVQELMEPVQELMEPLPEELFRWM